MKFLRHAQTVFWVAMALYLLIGLYGTIRTEMDRLQQQTCEQRDR